jgi:hypothetical protein
MSRFRHYQALSPLVHLLGLLLLATTAPAQEPPEVVNVGFSSDDMIRVDGDRVAFVAHETQEATDLNGDGDVGDRVVHLYDDALGSITNTGLAQAFVMSAADLHLRDDVLAFLVYEPAQKADLNGDGLIDQLVFVPHVHDIGTATTQNLGLEGRFPALGEGFLAFLVRESLQRQDLNGDSDQVDQVAHVYEPASGTLRNLGLDATGFAVGSTLAVFLVRETPGRDWNGDGDFSDAVVHTYDATTATVRNHGLAAVGLMVAGRLAGFLVSEAGEGRDLNGDGDTSDRVLHLYDGDTQATVSVGLYSESLVMSERLAAFTVPEFQQGQTDLNGDGDVLDRVLYVFDRANGSIRTLGLDPTFSMATAGPVVAFRAGEGAQGVDLNDDGDADDFVLHHYHADTLTITNLRLAVASPLAMDESLLTARVSEAQQGGVDRNGDGDAGDEILHAFHLATGTVANLGLTPAGHSPVVAGRFAFNARESENGLDLNGDLDLLDDVAHLYDGVRGQLTNLGLAALRPSPVIGEKLLAFAVTEVGQNRTDLNGDGDIGDSVLHVVRLVEPTPEELIQDLVDQVLGFGLDHGLENALRSKLEEALAFLAAGDLESAVGSIGAFVNQVEAQRGKKLTPEQADVLIALADEILALLEAGA